MPKSDQQLKEEEETNLFYAKIKDIRQHLRLKEAIKFRKQSLFMQKMQAAEQEKNS